MPRGVRKRQALTNTAHRNARDSHKHKQSACRTFIAAILPTNSSILARGCAPPRKLFVCKNERISEYVNMDASGFVLCACLRACVNVRVSVFVCVSSVTVPSGTACPPRTHLQCRAAPVFALAEHVSEVSSATHNKYIYIRQASSVPCVHC